MPLSPWQFELSDISLGAVPGSTIFFRPRDCWLLIYALCVLQYPFIFSWNKKFERGTISLIQLVSVYGAALMYSVIYAITTACQSMMIMVSFLFALPGLSHAYEWMPIESSPDGERYYLDLKSIQSQGPVVTFWAKNIDNRGEETRTRFSIHCGHGTAAIRDVVLYSSDETILKSHSYKDNNLQWGIISPHSFLKGFQRFLCKDKAGDHPPKLQ